MKYVITGFLFFLILISVSSCENELQQPVYTYALDNPAETGSRFPHLYRDETGTLFMSWIANIEEDIYALRYATYENERWTDIETIRLRTDFFVNWADFASVTGRNGTVHSAHWLKKTDGGPHAYDVQIAFKKKTDGGWDGEPITPHRDGTATEHGFVSMEPLDEDRVLAIWLDGRNTEERGEDEYEDLNQAMSLRSAVILRDGDITGERVIDPVVCDCCQTDLVPVEEGYLAVYRGRTEDEIRDIRVARYDAGSGEWSEPATVYNDNWQMMGCPVNGPRVSAQNENVAVVWYTEADDTPRVKLARSTDGGASFQEPVIVTEGDTAGRADVVLTGEGEIYVSWLRQQDEFGYIMLSRITPAGEPEAPVHVGTTSASRSSGFPGIAQAGNAIVFAWTQTEPLFRVRTASVPVGE